MSDMLYVRRGGVIWNHTGKKPEPRSYAFNNHRGVNRAKAVSHQLQMSTDGALGRGTVRRIG